MRQEELEISIKMSDAYFIKDPCPLNSVKYQIGINVFFENIDFWLNDDPYKIMGIFVNDKLVCLFHKDVLRYLIKIQKYSQDDLNEQIC